MNLNLIQRRQALLDAGYRENSKGELVRRMNETTTSVAEYPYKTETRRDRHGRVIGIPRTLHFREPVAA